MAGKNQITLSAKEKFFSEYFSRHKQYPVCPLCNKEIQRVDLHSAEYIKTRSGTEMFVHRACVSGKKVK